MPSYRHGLIRALIMTILVGTIMLPALAGVNEVEFHYVPDRNPEWYFGDGNYLMTLRGNGFTSWGSWNYYIDIDFKPDFKLETDSIYVELAPIVSMSKLFNITMPRWLTDVGLTAQFNHGLLDSRFQLIPEAWLYGVVLSFGGDKLDVLDIHLLYKAYKDYDERYEIAYIDLAGHARLAKVHDVWPYENGWQITAEWMKTWRVKDHEIFTRGFCDYWDQEWSTVEQWPAVFPGRLSKGPTWLAPGGEKKLLCQPQIGYRFGESNQFAIGSELEYSQNLYRVLDSRAAYTYKYDSSAFQYSLFLSMRF